MADGRVVIDVILDDGRVVKGVADINKSIGGLGQTAQKSAVSLGKIASALGLIYLAKKGIDLVRSSLDGAIERYDTLNNFPRVMQQIGFDAQDSEKAIQRLSDGIQGLPTTLDSVAKTTQRIAVMTGDLDGAVETTLALNNAFLASGASQADAARGLEQYVQMLAKGEVDLQSWRTLQETMGVALNDVAKAFGFAGKSAQIDLYEALKSGEITFDEFNDKLIELSNETGGFADRALTASGGIRTAFTNMRTAVVRGVTNIIGAIDDFLKDTPFESIENIIVNLGKTFFNTLDGVAQAIPNVLNGIVSMYNAIKPFIPLILGLVTAFLSFNAILGVVNKVRVAITTLRTAMLALNATMMANPVVLVIAVLAGLAAMFVYLWNTSETFRNTMIGVFNALKGLVMPIVQEVVSFVMELWGSLVTWWQENQQMILQAGQNVWNVISTVITTVMNVIWGIMQALWPVIQVLVISTWEAIKGAIKGAITVITGIIQFFSALFTGNWSALWDAVKQIVSGAVQLVWNLIQLWFVGRIIKVATTFGNLFRNVIQTAWNFVKNIFTTGVNLVRNVVSTGFNFIRNIISSVMNTVRSIISNIWNGIKSTVSSVVNSIRNTVSNIFNSLRGIVSNAFSRVRDAVRNGINRALDIVRNIKDKFFDAGRNIVQSIADGIRNAIGRVTDAIGDVASRVRDFLPFSPAKAGALKDLDKLNFGGTIAESIEKGENEALKAMDNLTRSLTEKIEPAFVNQLRGARPSFGNLVPAASIGYAAGSASAGSPIFSRAIDNKQPAVIRLVLGRREFETYVDDITEVQDRKSYRLERFRR